MSETGGVALVLVVWVLVVLVAIVGEFSYSMRTEINIARNFKEEEEAYQLALAGVEEAKLELLSVKDNAVAYIDGENRLVFDNLLALKEEAEAPQRKYTLGKGSFEYVIEDEDGKVDINTAPPEKLKEFFESSGVESTDVDTIVDSIVDWRDSNEEHHLNGAEEDYYRSLDTPYSCRDGELKHIDELLLVKGMTRDILYGSKTQKGDETEKEEPAYEGVAKFLTVFGSRRININTASRAVLEAEMGAGAAADIITQREAGPIMNARANGKVSSEFFTILSTGISGDGTIKRAIKTVVHKRGSELEILYWNDNYIG